MTIGEKIQQHSEASATFQQSVNKHSDGDSLHEARMSTMSTLAPILFSLSGTTARPQMATLANIFFQSFIFSVSLMADWGGIWRWRINLPLRLCLHSPVVIDIRKMITRWAFLFCYNIFEIWLDELDCWFLSCLLPSTFNVLWFIIYYKICLNDEVKMR